MRPITVRLCNWIGDVVMAIPAIDLLEQHGYQVHLYGKGWARTLLSGHGWQFTKRSETGLGDRIKELKAIRLQGRKVDARMDQRINALSFPNSFSSALELKLSGHKACGYTKDGRSLLLNDRLPRLKGVHVLETFWHLACHLTGEHRAPPDHIGFKIHPQAADKAEALLAQHGLQARAFACVVPFATGMMYQFDKKWPHFQELVRELSKSLPLIICPGPGEEAEADGFKDHATILPGVPLDVYAALMQRACVTLANDTGPGHLAAAVGSPVISILGPTDPAHWAPWGPNVTVVREWPQWPSAATVCTTALNLVQR
ncbi:MAG: glycosyltransferase family 9 protein [Aquabacterium sp.]